MVAKSAQRDSWGSGLGFLLAAVGSAVGLGNVWRFPMIVGQNGGAAFLLVYAVAVCLVGLPIMLAELAIGAHTQKGPVRALAELAPRTAWRYAGLFCVLTAVAILSYYSVIASWTLGYAFKTALGPRNLDAAGVAASFQQFAAHPGLAIALLAVFLVASMALVLGGIQRGIERWSRIFMPLLFIILVLLVVRSVTLPGATAGLSFYLRPDFSKITAATVLDAVSQAFFSLSLGMGIMITYGSYLPRKARLVSDCLRIGVADTLIAFIAGLAIFPALFTIPSLKPAEGPALVFLVLPNVFNQIPGGIIFGTGFFVLLTLAALTSAMSLMEVPVTWLIDDYQWSRKASVGAVGVTGFLLGVPSALSNGAIPALSKLPFGNKSFLEVMDGVFGKLCLTVAALALSVFVGWYWGPDRAGFSVRAGREATWIRASWRLLIRFVCPLALLLILLTLVL